MPSKNKPAAPKATAKAAQEPIKAPETQVEAQPPAAAAATSVQAPEAAKTLPSAAVGKPVHQQIGALLYYEDPKWTADDPADLIHFENLPWDERDIWYDRGRQCVEAIDKLNLVIVTKGAVAEQKVTVSQERAHVRKIIGDFVKTLNTTRPSLFPTDELVARIFPG